MKRTGLSFSLLGLLAFTLVAPAVQADSFFSRFKFFNAPKKQVLEPKKKERKAKPQKIKPEEKKEKAVEKENEPQRGLQVRAALRLRTVTPDEFNQLFPDPPEENSPYDIVGTCRQNISYREGEENFPGPEGQTFQVSYQECLDRMGADRHGHLSCPHRASVYQFVFHAEDYPTPPGREHDRIWRVNLGEKVCEYRPFLESPEQQNLRYFSFWELDPAIDHPRHRYGDSHTLTEEEKLAVYNFIRRMYVLDRALDRFRTNPEDEEAAILLREGLGFRKPWEGDDQPLGENCQHPRRAVYRLPGQGICYRDPVPLEQVNPPLCADWPEEEYNDNERRLAWVAHLATVLWLEFQGREAGLIPVSITEYNPEHLKNLFPESAWTGRSLPEGYRLALPYIDPFNVYLFAKQRGLLRPGLRQIDIVHNYIWHAKKGDPNFNQQPFRHFAHLCLYIPEDIIEQTGGNVTTADITEVYNQHGHCRLSIPYETADCAPYRRIPTPASVDYFEFWKRGAGDCGTLGQKTFLSLIHLNVPAEYHHYCTSGGREDDVHCSMHAYAMFNFYFPSENGFEVRRYSTVHNDDIFTGGLQDVAILIPETYHEKLYAIQETADDSGANMEYGRCAILLEHIANRCRHNRSLDSFQISENIDPANYCRNYTYTNRVYAPNPETGRVEFSHSEEKTIELLSEEQHARLLRNIRADSHCCRDTNGDPQMGECQPRPWFE